MTSFFPNIDSQTCHSRFIHQHSLFSKIGYFFFRICASWLLWLISRFSGFGPFRTWVRSVILSLLAPWTTPESLGRFEMQRNRFLTIEKMIVFPPQNRCATLSLTFVDGFVPSLWCAFSLATSRTKTTASSSQLPLEHFQTAFLILCGVFPVFPAPFPSQSASTHPGSLFTGTRFDFIIFFVQNPGRHPSNFPWIQVAVNEPSE